MLSKKGEQRSFSNGRLRDQWEKRAQTIADQCKREGQLKEKSSLKLLFSKWNYHWALVANGEQTKGETSDIHGATSGEEEKNKPKIKFKIVPPPPPQPKSKPAPPPSRRASPQPLIVRRKVEVDIFRLHWRESWMSLKPPKYLFLKANETKSKIQGFTTIVVVRDKKNKPVKYASELECTSTVGWSQSWKQVKSTTLSESSEERQFHWDILFNRDEMPHPEIGVYRLPLWAGTWKIMNFAFRQQKQKWDCEWPAFQQSFTKFDQVQQLLEQDEPPGWEDSWRLSKPPVRTEDCTLFELTVEIMKINDVLLMGWNKSWLISETTLEEEEDHEKIWSSCWLFRFQLRWCRSSLQSHQRHSNMMTRRRNIVNALLTSELNDGNANTSKWWDSWKTVKRWNPPEDDGLDEVDDNESEDSELFKDTEEEDEGVDNDEEEIEDDEEGSEDDKEKDEGVDEEEEAEDTEMEYNVENINIKTETHNGDNDENESNEEEEDTENQEKGKEDERQELNEEEDVKETEEDNIETYEMKLQNDHNAIHNHEEEEDDEDGDNRTTDDEKDKDNEQHNGTDQEEEEEELNGYDADNGVDTNENEEKDEVENHRKNDKRMDDNHGKEKQEYRNITLQLREIFRMISNESLEDEEKDKNEGEDRESIKIQAQVHRAGRETHDDDADKEEEVEEADVETEEEHEEEEDEKEWGEVEEKDSTKEAEGEEEDFKETDEEEDEIEDKDSQRNIEEDEDEEDKDANDDENDKEHDHDENGEKNADEDDSDEGDDKSNEWDNNVAEKKKHADCEWRKDSREQSRGADTKEELQEAEQDEDEIDDVEEYVSFDDEDKGEEKVLKTKVDEDDDKEASEEETEEEKETEEEETEEEKETEEEEIEEIDKFHKLNTAFSLWKQSWMVAVAHRISDEDEEEDDMEGAQEEVKAWQESWRICHWRKPHENEVACFYRAHWQVKQGLMNEDYSLLKKKWTLSWKMTKKGKDMK
ncbi:uncharacterized protein LOC144002759 [Festucalex cinctus]